ncbi:hypothetical protein [Bacillus toyonensis]|uniref:hypothetical protein n=1 Tax=Bacillus toyonensis TaxID=155322 RepID=UPI0015D508FA|nr:hypothetical protein [Bacillus toyonensis]
MEKAIKSSKEEKEKRNLVLEKLRIKWGGIDLAMSVDDKSNLKIKGVVLHD